MKTLIALFAVLALGLAAVGCDPAPKDESAASSAAPASGIKDKTPKMDDEEPKSDAKTTGE